MESVETKTSSPASTDAQLMLSDSTPTAGAHTDPPGASPAAVEENIPTEKPKKRKKKKGIRAFFRRIGKAIKPYIFCCNGNNKVTPFPYSDPTDGQPDLSGLEWALSVDTCPSGIKLPVNGDPPNPELSSLADISSLELTSESDLELPSISGPAIMELMSVSDVSSLKLAPEGEPELSSVSGPAIMELMSVSDVSSLELTSESDLELPSISGPAIMELMSVLDVSSLKMAPEGDPANLEQSSVTGPTILDSELTLDPELMFVSRSSSLEKTSLNRNEQTPDSSQVDPESSPAPGPSELDSRNTEALGKQTKKSMKKYIRVFFQRTWKTVKFSTRCYGKNQVGSDPCGINPKDPADLQPHISGLTWELTGPDPSYFEQTSDPFPDDPGSSLVPSPSSLEPVANQDGADSQSGSVSLDSQLTLDPGPSNLVPGPSSHEVIPVGSSSSPSSLELTPEMANPEPVTGAYSLDVPAPSDFWPATGLFSCFYEVKEELGSGSFGNVCEGIRRFDGQKVAIKRLKKRNFDSHIILPGSTKPLLSELAVNLLMRKTPQSPHVVQMLDWFDMPEHPIIIMEFPYPCETLFSFTMRNGGVLDETVARGLMRQAVLGAKHCIDRGVFHNDINTDNILVNTETLQLKIIDFGRSELFKTAYGRELAVKSTVWSLGIVLLDTVSRDQDNSVFQSRKHGPQVLGLSNECCDLIKRCLQHYPTLESMLEHKWFQSN